MAVDLRKVTLKLNADVYEQVEVIANKKGESVSQVIRDLICAGLNERVLEENTDLMLRVVRDSMEAVLKPHTERLARLMSKSGHMSAAAAFLNVQSLMDLVPKEKRKDVRDMYENARKKAAVYMKTKTEDWESDL